MREWRWLVLILGLAFALRTWNVDWDSGYHFHPDERWIVMVTEKIDWVNPVTNWDLFTSVESPMNPKFFAYGSLPIYLLKLVSVITAKVLGDPVWSQYSKMNLVGRVMSALFDTGTVWLVYLIGCKLLVKGKETPSNSALIRGRTIGLWAAGFYAVAVLPIQLSHFYAVDTILTFFITLVIYLLLRFAEKPRWAWIIGVGVAAGMVMATKVSGVMLAVPIGVSLIVSGFNIRLTPPSLPLKWEGKFIPLGKGELEGVRRETRKVWVYLRQFGMTVIWGLMIFCIAITMFLIFEPYAVIDRETFWRNMQEQGRMTKDAWAFPYTLQYVGTKAYIYPLEQIIKYGMGWGLGLLGLTGVGITIWYLVLSMSSKLKAKSEKLQLKSKNEFKNSEFSLPAQAGIQNSEKKILKQVQDDRLTCNLQLETRNLLIILSFMVVYFMVIGGSAVKFMRYLLPLYPLLCLLAVAGVAVVSYQLSVISKKLRVRNVFLFLCFLVFLSTGLWTYGFMSRVYGQENTRIQASQWLARELETRNLKLETIGIEHWDDGLPVSPWNQGFQAIELPLYEPDSEHKWQLMAKKLAQVDAIVLASNRLWVPLMRIGGEKYGITKRYYELLFSGDLGFEEVADFHVMPGIGPPAGGWSVDTQKADESFQVYDHPRVRVFEKVKPLDKSTYYIMITSLYYQI